VAEGEEEDMLSRAEMELVLSAPMQLVYTTVHKWGKKKKVLGKNFTGQYFFNILRTTQQYDIERLNQRASVRIYQENLINSVENSIIGADARSRQI